MKTVKKVYFLRLLDRDNCPEYVEHEFDVPQNNIPGVIRFRWEHGKIVLDKRGKDFFIYRD